MKKKINILIVFAGAILFTLIFHRQALGLNLLIFETILFSWFTITKAFRLKGIVPITSGLSLMASALFTVLTHSIFSYVMNFLALVLYIGILIYPEARSILTSMGLSVANFLLAQVRFFEGLVSIHVQGRRLGRIIWSTRIFTIPLIIILLFVIIYGNANPVFAQLMEDISQSIETFLDSLFKDFDALVIFTFILGLVICNLFFFRAPIAEVIQLDAEAKDELTRRKHKRSKKFRMTGLKNEYKAGVFLLLVLNAILLVLNVIDVHWVWFNFEWEGQYLKQFVHEGTYLLILSILISVAVVLFFFRGNLNFYTRNNLLKYLGYGWIAQNIVLAISVAIRNFYYIHHFALAYKRIGVIIFLILTIYGLLTVFAKVRRRKSTFHLLKVNALAIYSVLIISSFFNWDSIIARYNFRHSDTSFLHLDFLSTLSNKALPHLDKTLPELMEIDTVQKSLFPFEQEYMTPLNYHHIIQNRKLVFLREWEAKSILSWNLPEYLAYQRLRHPE